MKNPLKTLIPLIPGILNGAGKVVKNLKSPISENTGKISGKRVGGAVLITAGLNSHFADPLLNFGLVCLGSLLLMVTIIKK